MLMLFFLSTKCFLAAGPSRYKLNKAPKMQMPRCSSMYARLQLADAYDSTYACSRSMEASNSSMEARNVH